MQHNETGISLNLIFGHGHEKDVGKIVNAYDFHSDQASGEDENNFLHVALAPTFGELNSQSVRLMDDAMKIMIAGTMRALAKVPAEQRTWMKVTEILMQSPLLEPDKDEISRADKLLKSGFNLFKLTRKDITEDVVVREVMAWFTHLIQDQDVLSSTKIDIRVMAGIVAKTGAAIEVLGDMVYNKESQSKTIVDIGVLRFPDIIHPYFKVYHIKLEAWSQSKRLLVVQDNKSGITGEFHSRKFRPRREIIDQLSSQVKNKAIQEAEALFG